MRTWAMVVLVAVTSAALAERRPEDRKEADAVVVGVIKKITTKESPFGDDGVNTTYTAEVEVATAEKGTDVKAGETIKVTWSHVTKRPSTLLPGAYGQDHKVKKDDEAKFWLMGTAKKGFSVIYNKDGIEKVKK